MSLSVFDGHLYVVCCHYDFVYSYVAASRTCCLSEFHPDSTSWMINTACSTYVVLHCRLDLFVFFFKESSVYNSKADVAKKRVSFTFPEDIDTVSISKCMDYVLLKRQFHMPGLLKVYGILQYTCHTIQVHAQRKHEIWLYKNI